MSVRIIIPANDVNNGDALAYSDVFGNKKRLDRSNDETIGAYDCYGINLDPDHSDSVSISGGSGGDNVLVSGIPTRQMELLSYSFATSGNTQMSIRSGDNILHGPMLVAQGTTFNQANNVSLLRTNAGEDLIINSDSSGGLNGSISYRIL
jgi:hypothetical protein